MNRIAKSFPLRLAASMRVQASELAEREGISLNQFINIAVAEKIGHMEEQARMERNIPPAERLPFPRIGGRPGSK